MHAMIVDAQQNLIWTEVPDPAPRSDEILIEVHAAALNRADLLQRAGKYPPPPGWPEWMGLEVAGTVLAAPPGGRWRRGDRACALLGGGGYAEQVAAPEAMAMPIPKGLSMAEAASLPEVYATACLNLCLEAGLKAGETVLVHAAASGLGIAAIQLAKACGANVVATVRSPEKARAAQNYGADIVVDRRTDDLDAVLDQHPPDVVLDCVGGPDLGRHLGKMAVGGRWILVATLGGESAEIPLRPLLKRGLRLIGSTLRSRSPEVKARILRALEETVWPGLASGAIRTSVHRVLPIAQAAEAHAILQRNENIGKVVLTVKNP
jgi:NADPH2:quinone reductase